MPLYTFYPTQADGLAPSFETLNLEDHNEAMLETLRVFDRHDSASSVVVYFEQRMIYNRRRMDASLSAVLSRVQPA